MTPDVTLWTTPTCPDCRALKAWLDADGILYAERDLTDPDTMAEAKRRFGVRVAPITQVGEWFAYGTFAEQRRKIEAELQATAERDRLRGELEV